MQTVLGVGVELAGDFALVGADEGSEGPRLPYAASVAGAEAVVAKFEADIVSAWGDTHYAWDGIEVYGAGGYRLMRSKRPDGATHGLVVSKVFLTDESQERETDGLLALDGDLAAAFAAWWWRCTPCLSWRRGLPKARKGQRARDGIASLAIDFEARAREANGEGTGGGATSFPSVGQADAVHMVHRARW